MLSMPTPIAPRVKLATGVELVEAVSLRIRWTDWLLACVLQPGEGLWTSWASRNSFR